MVHCLNREMHEMLAAIEGWMPLYMSRMVESYYCIHDTHTVFSHTLFVCSDTAVIEACNVNDRIRFHPKLNNYYEKYDKSQDTYLICPACLAKNSPEKDRCVYCHVPLLK